MPGRSRHPRGDFQEALGRYEKVLARDPRDGEALNNAVQALVRLDRPAEAVRLLAVRWSHLPPATLLD
jgi:hypothetical protein